jgi:hypothetical protein
VLVHRPHERRQREDPGPREGYSYQRPSVCDWALCVLRDVYCEVCYVGSVCSKMGWGLTKRNSELPSNLVLKKMSPKIWLPLLTAVWGILTMCLGFVRNFASFVTVRALLGVAEGGLLPGMVTIPSHSIYSTSYLTKPHSGPLPLPFLPPQRTRPPHRHLLHRGLPLRRLRRPPRPRPQRHRPLGRPRRLALDLHR